MTSAGLASSPTSLDPLERVRRHVDAHLHEALTLDALAAVAGLSPFHFVRQFTARYGISPMAHVRSRRLSAAAQRLVADRRVNLIELAFDCGFDSQEGFTRAFRRAFGMPPGRYRSLAPHAPKMEDSLMTAASAPLQLTQSTAVFKPGLRIAGLSAVFAPAGMAGIPQLWARLDAAVNLAALAAGSFGACMAAPEGEPGTLRYLAGVRLEEGESAPAGLEVITLEPRSYLVFRQVLNGPDLHPQMQAAAREIWGERLPRSGVRLAQAPDLEFYPPGFKPGAPDAWVEWWIPVEP